MNSRSSKVYWPDINKSRELAKKLLKEAGHENLTFTLTNRGVDQPYKLVGTWAIDQWRKIGVKVKQDVVTTPIWYERLRKSKDFDVSTDANCQSIVNPIADVSKWLGIAGANYADYETKARRYLRRRCSNRATRPSSAQLMRDIRDARDLGPSPHDDRRCGGTGSLSTAPTSKAGRHRPATT